MTNPLKYNKHPFIEVNFLNGEPKTGWINIKESITSAIGNLKKSKKIVLFDTYQGVHDDEILQGLVQPLNLKTIYTRDYFLNEKELEVLLQPYVTDDEIFGYMNRLTMINLFDTKKLNSIRQEIESQKEGIVLIYGPGASLLSSASDLLVYFDMPRWEIQLRFRNNTVGNLGFQNNNHKTSLQYKQAFFVDWRICDRHKKTIMPVWDFVVDTTTAGSPVMIHGKDLNTAYQHTSGRPFRFVPFFDPGPWGGKWMMEKLGLPKDVPNYAWAFDCVAEENSIVYKFGNTFFETPGINLVFAQPEKLLGPAVHARFGEEFPIRFDFLDTIEGGNLSLQVHPTTGYIQEKFGMHYTQDESYYMLDATEGATVYLGLKDDINPTEMIADLHKAQKTASDFDVDKYVQQWPAKKHDHFLIPAGTIHCSGKNSMVLEISATPYIFTFKLWDWNRMGLDGKPRSINIEHGKNVINWSVTPAYTQKHLINDITTIASGDGWQEEKTGLHEKEFIETRRHWFTKKVTHYTEGSVNVLNLVEGDEVIVESPENKFTPFKVNYAETFVIPASVNVFTITPYGNSEGRKCATIKARVRTGITHQPITG
jgi:mannose-6-phosphate isomerase class I